GDGYGNAFHIVSAVNAPGSGDVMRFGVIDLSTRQYTQISQTVIGNVAGATGLVVVPGPGGLALLAGWGLLGRMAPRRRRSRRRACASASASASLC
ncbi:MAG: hypothetical protein KDA22_10220, partial [Phycisphaerales bacterium]|nr:hypothetical protein [Phycisphaerales bacterium]